MGAQESTSTAPANGFYFYLSYAQSPPVLEQKESRPDRWVTTFYRDLAGLVQRLSPQNSTLQPGFMDQPPTAGGDWTGKVSDALGSAEVFVPLYSPMYLRRSWPLNELNWFRDRLHDVDPQAARGHVQPVLWVPVLGVTLTPELEQALALDASNSAYTRNGLMALCRLSVYREQYERVLQVLAERIIQVAESSPLPRRRTFSRPVRGTTGPTRPTGPVIEQQTRFVIGVIAPIADEAPVAEFPSVYGSMAADWRPYESRRQTPAAVYAATVAERLGQLTELIELTATDSPKPPKPCLVLVDPWILAVPGGRDRLLAAVGAMPDWSLVVVLVDESEPRYPIRGEALHGELRDLLGDLDRPLLVRNVTDESTFVELTPWLVTQAMKRFLALYRPLPPGRRKPRLLDPSDPITDNEEDR